METIKEETETSIEVVSLAQEKRIEAEEIDDNLDIRSDIIKETESENLSEKPDEITDIHFHMKFSDYDTFGKSPPNNVSQKVSSTLKSLFSKSGKSYKDLVCSRGITFGRNESATTFIDVLEQT